MRTVWKNRAYRRLWCNSLFYAYSYGGDFVLIGWSILALTGTSAWVGTAFALYFLPMVLLGILTGGLADRLDRRRLLRALEMTTALVLGAFALLFSVLEPKLVTFFVMTGVLGTLRALHSPVRLSYAFDLAGPTYVTPALAGLSIATRIGMLGGALVSGTIADRFGISWALALMAASHLFAFLSLLGQSESTSIQQRDPAPILQNMTAILTELVRNRVLLILTALTAAIEIFGPSIYSALPELADLRFSKGAEGLGWMHAAQACGGLIMGLFMLLLPPGRKNTLPYFASIVLLGLSLVMLGLFDGFALTLFLVGLTAAAISAWDILTQSIIQLAVPDRLRGRAMGAWTFAIGTAPLGHLEMGFLAALIGVEQALSLNGLAVLAIIALSLAVTPQLRRI